MELFNKIRYYFFALISLLNLSIYGRVIKELNNVGEANCPNGWTSNMENTRCFKLMMFDKPRTFSHGFRICNELGGTEVFTRRRNGIRESKEYPVTLATVYKYSDDEAIKRVLGKHISDIRTRNGCFVGLRKYAFFKYPPGWYWIDSSHPISIKDSEINWSSSYNSNWLVKFKFPFEKCGFYDNGGLGRRPCWLIDSELSCAICGTVAYDSGGLNPTKYFELIKQADDIMNKEPKLDLPIYSNLNCTDSWENSASIGLCQNVSNILDSAWSSYQNSIYYPNINLNWKEIIEPKNDIIKSFSNNDTKYRQKKAFFWDQDIDSVPALSEEIKLQSLNAQPKYYTVEKDKITNSDNRSEDIIYAQSSNLIKDILLPVTKTVTESTIYTYPNKEIFTNNDIKKITDDKEVISNSIINKSNNFVNNLNNQYLNNNDNIMKNNIETNITNKENKAKANTKKAILLITTTTTTKVTESIIITKKPYRTKYTTENVRTNTFTKKNVNNYNSNNGAKYEKEIDNSLLGFGAGESINQENLIQDDTLSIQMLENSTEINQLDKSTENDLSLIGENKNISMIIIFLLGGILILGLLLVCCIIFIKRNKKENDHQNSNLSIENDLKKDTLMELKLSSIKPILSKNGSKILPMNQQQTTSNDNNLTRSEKSIVSVEDTTFSPEYMNTTENAEGTKPTSYYIAQSQANTLQLHSDKGITVNYDTRTQIQKNNLVKSPKYHDFYYSEANAKSRDY